MKYYVKTVTESFFLSLAWKIIINIRNVIRAKKWLAKTRRKVLETIRGRKIFRQKLYLNHSRPCKYIIGRSLLFYCVEEHRIVYDIHTFYKYNCAVAVYTEIDKDRMSEPIRRETGRTNVIQNVERLDKWSTTVVPIRSHGSQ